MKIVSIIPARSGSKSIPNKNIIKLGKHPLIAYSIAESLLSQYIQETIVSTDSENIADIAKKYGASVPYLRPEEISKDDSTDKEFFQYHLDYLERNEMIVPDLIVHLRPTTPLREISVIDKAIERMMDNQEATALLSAHKIRISPFKMFRLEGKYMVPFSRYSGIEESFGLPRQTFEDTYVQNGYVDVINPDILLNTGLLYGNKIEMWETAEVPDIDILSDYEGAKKQLSDFKFKHVIDYYTAPR
jgi:CMP-N-acetylneuraminic acid synthetase